jgi:hypothetical protein
LTAKAPNAGLRRAGLGARVLAAAVISTPFAA